MTALLTRTTWTALGALAALGVGAGAAAAQTADANASSFNAGYGRSSVAQDNTWRNTAARDQNGNRMIVDGIIQTGDSNSIYSRQGGAGDNVSGAGVLGGATAIGNSLNVVVQGNRNTVVVNSRQVNNGNVTAGVTNVTPVVQSQGSPAGSPNTSSAAGASATASATSSATAAAQGGATGLVLNGFDAGGTSGVGSTTLNGEIHLDDSGL